MHTMEEQGWRITYNGDFSGEIRFASPQGDKSRLPFTVLEAVVAEKVRGERIERLEQASAQELLSHNTRHARPLHSHVGVGAEP